MCLAGMGCAACMGAPCQRNAVLVDAAGVRMSWVHCRTGGVWRIGRFLRGG